jgi:hypothetical protein
MFKRYKTELAHTHTHTHTSACDLDDSTYELPSNADSYMLGYGVSSIAAMPSPSAKIVSVKRCKPQAVSQVNTSGHVASMKRTAPWA